MNPYSDAALQALGLGPSGPTSPRDDASTAMATPVVDVVDDPNREVFALKQDLEEAMLGPGPRSRRQRRTASLDRMGASGLVVLEDRRCCIELLMGENQRLHLRRLPYAVTCPDCERTFRIRMGVRTERRRRGR